MKVKNIREPQDDWIGLYEEDIQPSEGAPSIWWIYTSEPEDGVFSHRYDPKDNEYSERYKENATYKMVYFYRSGYDVVAAKAFKVKGS